LLKDVYGPFNTEVVGSKMAITSNKITYSYFLHLVFEDNMLTLNVRINIFYPSLMKEW